MFRITYTGGRTSSTHETLEEARETIRVTWPEAFFWANDDRELAWANEQDSEDDDGYKAVASIYAIE